jgi:uncharacterized Zn finger protein (UPF0148 family)
MSNSNTMSNGESVDEENGKKSTSNIKSAADLLIKGGTLLSDSCTKCNGVQVRYKDETICVSCGRKIKDTTKSDVMQQQQQQQIENDQQEQQHSIPSTNLSKKKELKGPTVFDSSITSIIYTKIINDKINLLITTLEKENDILIQNTKLDLISKYLEVLDKLKIISNNHNSNKKS